MNAKRMSEKQKELLHRIALNAQVDRMTPVYTKKPNDKSRARVFSPNTVRSLQRRGLITLTPMESAIGYFAKLVKPEKIVHEVPVVTLPSRMHQKIVLLEGQVLELITEDGGRMRLLKQTSDGVEEVFLDLDDPRTAFTWGGFASKKIEAAVKRAALARKRMEEL